MKGKTDLIVPSRFLVIRKCIQVVISLTLSAGAFGVTGDENWDGRFGVPNNRLDGGVYAVAASGSNVYIGGYFTTAGTLTVNRVAKWDGISWSALGSGVDVTIAGTVYSAAVRGSDLLIGGQFFSDTGVFATNNIAIWNGSSWVGLGKVTSFFDPKNVNAIAVATNGDVYVGGTFNTVAGVLANYIAKWDGANWSSLGSGISNGVNAAVLAIAVNGSDVYAGGRFTTAGGIIEPVPKVEEGRGC